MKIAAIYSTYYDLDVLEKSIKSIKKACALVIVVHQKTGFNGKPEHPQNKKILSKLTRNKLIDHLIIYEPQEDKQKGMIQKRNLALQYAKSKGCTHILSMDADERYNADEIIYNVNEMIAGKYSTCYFPIKAYYGDEKTYFTESYYVQSLHRIDERIFEITKTSLLCDPTRKMKEKRYMVARSYLHHYTFIKGRYDVKLDASIRTIGNSSIANDMRQISDHLKKWKYRNKALVFTNDMSQNGKVILAEKEVTRLNDELYTVIIPTMWRSNDILKMIKLYQENQRIKEIIIIDNDPARKLEFDLTKVRILTKGENIFVNPAWNWGVDEATTERIIIANDDIYIPRFAELMEIIHPNLPERTMMGIHADCYKMKDTKIKLLESKNNDLIHRGHGFGCFMVMHKLSYVPINENIKIWYGDNIQFFKNNVLKIYGCKVETKMSTTVNMLRNIAAKDETSWIKYYYNQGRPIMDNEPYTLKEMKVSFNMATYPARSENLEKVIKSILPQCDVLRIYLNEYKFVPDCCKHDKIEVVIGGENLKDTGKFYWAGTKKNEYYFTVDDDFIYPKDYAKKHIEAIKKHNAVVCMHGRILKNKPKHWTDVFKCFEYFKELNYDEYVNYCGTGTVAFDNSRLIVDLSIFEHNGMTDEYFSYHLRKNNIPILCRSHNKDELKPLIYDNSLWSTSNERAPIMRELFNDI